MAIFCDDIRHEVNGKITLVGCYSDVLNFNGKKPQVLPKFGAFVSVRIPWDKVPKTLEIVTTIESDVQKTEIGRLDINVDKDKSVDASNGLETVENLVAISIPFEWSSLQIERECEIRIRGTVPDGEEIKIGRLSVKFPNDGVEE